MMRRIVTSLGRTTFQSRNFKAFRMSARDEPAGFGANTGVNFHSNKPGQQKNWTSDSKNQMHDFNKDSKLEQKSQSKAYKTDTQRASNEGMTQNKNDTLRTANTNETLGKNTRDNTGKDTAKPWEATGQDTTQTKADSMHKPVGQQGPGAFKSGSHMTDNLRTTGANNTWEANHVHNDKCGHTYDKNSSTGQTNQYEAKNVGAKTCQNDSAACRMDSGKCSTHTSHQTSQTGPNWRGGNQDAQQKDQGMIDKAMCWVKEKLGGATNQPTNSEIKQKNRATADSDKAFNDKKESKHH